MLVTSDDGVTVPDSLAFNQAMRELDDPSILAPDKNWSGGGHEYTIHRPLLVREVQLADDSSAYASVSVPSGCVALGLLLSI